MPKHPSPVKQIKPEIPFNTLIHYHFQDAGLTLMLPTQTMSSDHKVVKTQCNSNQIDR